MANPPSRRSPVQYDEEIVSEILGRMISGESLATILSKNSPAERQDGYPSWQAWFNWLAEGEKEDSNERFKRLIDRYARACKARTMAHQEILLDEAMHPRKMEIRLARKRVNEKNGIEEVEEVRIVDNTERSRLAIDALKWTMAHLEPKKYGKLIEPEPTGDDNKIIIENAPDGG